MRVAYTTPCRSRPRLSAASRRTLSSPSWSTPRVHAFTRARTRAQANPSPLSEFRASLSKLARSLPNNDGEEASHFTQIYHSMSPRVPGSRRMWQNAMRGRSCPGVRLVTMCPENDVALLRWRERPQEESRSLVALFADALMRAIRRGGGVLLKADRILCNGLNVVARPFALSVPRQRYFKLPTMSDVPISFSTHCTPIFADGKRWW